MWKHHKIALAYYGLLACDEWIKRGFNSTIHENFINVLRKQPKFHLPTWITRQDVLESHQANLVRKDFLHYTYSVEPRLGYIWPVDTEEDGIEISLSFLSEPSEQRQLIKSILYKNANLTHMTIMEVAC
jgi:hypothetical protein